MRGHRITRKHTKNVESYHIPPGSSNTLISLTIQFRLSTLLCVCARLRACMCVCECMCVHKASDFVVQVMKVSLCILVPAHSSKQLCVCEDTFAGLRVCVPMQRALQFSSLHLIRDRPESGVLGCTTPCIPGHPSACGPRHRPV